MHVQSVGGTPKYSFTNVTVFLGLQGAQVL